MSYLLNRSAAPGSLFVFVFCLSHVQMVVRIFYNLLDAHILVTPGLCTHTSRIVVLKYYFGCEGTQLFCFIYLNLLFLKSRK